ncbi:MAG: RHS repeat-associated core domain-containing protein, partial [Bacteroidota bacterium]
RFYSPSLGRFLSTDPIGYAGGMNLYAYAGNDPINATDPMGLCHLECLEDGAGGSPGTPNPIDNIIVNPRGGAIGPVYTGYDALSLFNSGGGKRFSGVSGDNRPPKAKKQNNCPYNGGCSIVTPIGSGPIIFLANLAGQTLYQVTINYLNGVKNEARARRHLYALGYLTVEQIRFLDPATNTVARIDFVGYDPIKNVYTFVEVKSGNAELTNNQKIVYQAIANGTAIPLSGDVAEIKLIPRTSLAGQNFILPIAVSIMRYWD